MKHIRILSIDEVLISQLTSAFLRRKGYEMMPAAHEGAELLELLLRERTDIVVIDLALPVLDGLDVLEVASALPLPQRPMLFAVADVCRPRMIELTERALTYCFIKPLDATAVVSQIAEMAAIRTPFDQVAGAGYPMLDKIVTELLFRMGVSPHLNGYHLLREAVKLVACVRLPSRLSVMQDLYPAVAQLCMTSVSMAEHAMRHAIENAWMRADINTLQSCFGYTVHELRDTPSNSAFIYMLADRVRMYLAGDAGTSGLSPLADRPDQYIYA